MSRRPAGIRAAIAGIAAAMLCGVVSAQNYPNRPIRLVLPFPAGAPSDILGRAIGERLARQLNANVVPDNRPGAGGNLGLELAAKAPADGYTLVVATPGISISPSLYRKLNYNAETDLEPIARLAALDNMLVVHPSIPAKSLKEFVDLARKNPGKLNYGSGGPGTTNHLANELLQMLTGIKMLHVPYKGATVATLALLSGEVDEVVVSVASALPLVKSGKVRALAVLGEKRVTPLPELPTAQEAGVPGLVMSIWYGLYGPGGLPRDLVTRLNGEMTKALAAPDFRQRLTSIGYEPWPSTPEELRAFQKSETGRFAKIIKTAGLKPR